MKVVLLAGGVGGAKLADGLAQILPAEDLTIIVNTGDDFEHLGLKICPDLDTVMYTLAGVANPETGWGRTCETQRVFDELRRLNGPDWFLLGDLDLATHLLRTQMLDDGQSLTAVTYHLCQQLGVQVRVVPMSDQLAPTIIDCEKGRLPFQTWFVREKWQPRVKQIILPDDVKAPHGALSQLEKADIVVIAPSNPFVSVDPILNVYPIREMVMDLPQAVVAVSPIIGGRAVKGPAAKMMGEMGMPVSAAAVAGYYGDLIDGLVCDLQDEKEFEGLDTAQLYVNTWMRNQDDRIALAKNVMGFATKLANGS